QSSISIRLRSTIMGIFSYLMIAAVILIYSLAEQDNAAVLRFHKNVAKPNQITDGDIEVKSAYPAKFEEAQDTREKRSAHVNLSAFMPGPRMDRHRRHIRRHLKLRRHKSRSNVHRRIMAGRNGTWTWLPAYKRYAWFPEEKSDKDDSFSKIMRYGK
ncbi:unnamed protein product, partial [Owenia fusiformis]